MRSNTVKGLTKNFSALSLATAATLLLGFISGTYLARLLGPKDFGVISFALAFVGYYALLLNKGIDYFGAREVAQFDQNNVKILKLYLDCLISIRVASLLIAWILLAFSVWIIGSWSVKEKIVITLYGLYLLPVALSVEWFLQGIQKMEFIALGQVIGQASYMVAILVLIKSPSQLMLIPALYFVSNLLSLSFMLWHTSKLVGLPRWHFDILFWQTSLRKSIPMGLSAIMTQVYHSLDLILLDFLIGSQAVGLYRAVYRLMPLFFILPGALGTAFFPLFSSMNKVEGNQLSPTVDVYLRLMVSMALPVGVINFLFANDIISIIYGNAYAQSTIVLKIMAWNFMMALLSFTYGHQLLALNQQVAHLKIVISGAVANTLLNLILIPMLGLVGAALAKVMAETVVFVGFFVVFNKFFRQNTLRYFIKPILSSVTMAIVIVYTQRMYSQFPFSLISLTLGGLVYFGVLIGSGFMSKPINYVKLAWSKR